MFIRSAQLGGLVKTLIDGLLGVVNQIFDLLVDPVVSFLADTIWRGIAGFIYQLVCVPVLLLIDVVNLMFRKLAGLSSYYDKSIGSTVEGDFVYSLITSKAIMNVFWAMVILGVILLIICTFIAVIKSEFTPLNDKNGSNNKWKIITVAVKSLVNMAVVPVCALVGIMIGNALLNTLDQATNLESAPISGRVFVASAYNCNMVRMAINDEIETSSDEYKMVNQFANNCYGKDFNRLTDAQKENLAETIDNVFASCSTFDSWMKESAGIFGLTIGNEASFYDVDEVYSFYHVGYFNFLVFIITSLVIGTMMIMIMIGLIKRIFTLVTLFVVAPPIVAVTPINAEGLKKWNTSFIKNTLSAYSSVVCMNLFLIIVRAFDNISFFKGDTIGNSKMASTLSGFGDEFAKIFILIGGLVFVKELTTEIAGLIGADSAFAIGSDKAKDYAAAAGKVAGLAAGGLSFAGSALKAVPGVSKGINTVKGLGTKMSSKIGDMKDNHFINKQEEAKKEIMNKAGEDGSLTKRQQKKLNAIDEKIHSRNNNIQERHAKRDAKLEKIAKDDSKTMKQRFGDVKDSAKGYLGTFVNETAGADNIEAFLDSKKKNSKKGGVFKPSADAATAEKAKKEREELLDTIRSVGVGQKEKDALLKEKETLIKENQGYKDKEIERQTKAQIEHDNRSKAAKKGWNTRRKNAKKEDLITRIDDFGVLHTETKEEAEKAIMKERSPYPNTTLSDSLNRAASQNKNANKKKK